MLRPRPQPAIDPFGYAALLKIAAPLAATVGCFSLTLFTDRTLLMWYGPTSSAASVSAGNLYWTIACIPVTAMGYVTPLAAMAIGSGQADRSGAGGRRSDRRVWSLVWQAVWMTLAMLPVFGVVAFLAPWIFHWVDHAAELAVQETLYFRVLLLVAPAAMLETGMTAFFVARRVTRPIFLANVIAALLNIAFDIWFIFGGWGLPPMGVLGAALATAVAMWLKICLFAALLVHARRNRPIGRYGWRPRPQLMTAILLPGTALGLQQLLRSAGFSWVLLMIGTASVTGLAATSAAMSVYQLLSIPAIGLATAITVFVGQGVGTLGGQGMGILGDRSDGSMVISRSLRIAILTATLVAGLLFLGRSWLIDIPLLNVDASERSKIEPLATKLLALASLYALFEIIGLAMASVCKGLGRTFPILVSTACSAGLVLAFGWWTAPAGELGVGHWWITLITWSFAQFALLGLALRNAILGRFGKQYPMHPFHLLANRRCEYLGDQIQKTDVAV